jgi:gelsolin
MSKLAALKARFEQTEEKKPEPSNKTKVVVPAEKPTAVQLSTQGPAKYAKDRVTGKWTSQTTVTKQEDKPIQAPTRKEKQAEAATRTQNIVSAKPAFEAGKKSLEEKKEFLRTNASVTTKKIAVVKKEETNVDAIGSKEDKNLRHQAASSAEEWKGAGKVPGTQVWRIEKFQVKPWPQLGVFYDGDSFIVLHTYLVNDKFKWNLHFWLGKDSTMDEIGTAAYKAVELDDFLDQEPVQYRECQGHESALFLSYFPSFQVLSGGIESGFSHVKPEEYKPRLLQVKGKIRIAVNEVPLSASSMNDGDCFVLDTGLKLFIWEGSKSRKGEIFAANQYAQGIKTERGMKPTIVTLDEKGCDELWKVLKGSLADVKRVSDQDNSDDHSQLQVARRVFHLSDESGTMKFTEVSPSSGLTGLIPRSMLNNNDVFIIDVGTSLFVWVGSGASPDERKHSMHYAIKYIQQYNRPNHKWYKKYQIAKESFQNSPFFL